MNNEIFNTFDASHEHGAGEWKTFNAVAHDRTAIFHAAMNYRPKARKETAIRFGESRMFVMKHA